MDRMVYADDPHDLKAIVVKADDTSVKSHWWQGGAGSIKAYQIIPHALSSQEMDGLLFSVHFDPPLRFSPQNRPRYRQMRNGRLISSKRR